MISEEDVERAVHRRFQQEESLARAKAEHGRLVAFTKVLKAQLMQKHLELPLAGQEREAYADPEYAEHLEIIAEAEERVLKLQYNRDDDGLLADVWRTQSSNARAVRL